MIYEPINVAYPTLPAPGPAGRVINTRWYLGLSGSILPGKGFGIETIAKDSPAELAGLKPGMVVTYCNDIAITDSAALNDAIAGSGGQLNMTLLDSVDGEPIEASVAMQQLVQEAF